MISKSLFLLLFIENCQPKWPYLYDLARVVAIRIVVHSPERGEGGGGGERGFPDWSTPFMLSVVSSENGATTYIHIHAKICI